MTRRHALVLLVALFLVAACDGTASRLEGKIFAADWSAIEVVGDEELTAVNRQMQDEDTVSFDLTFEKEHAVVLRRQRTKVHGIDVLYGTWKEAESDGDDLKLEVSFQTLYVDGKEKDSPKKGNFGLEGTIEIDRDTKRAKLTYQVPVWPEATPTTMKRKKVVMNLEALSR